MLAHAAENVGTTHVARWHDDRSAALVLMFDDSTPSQAANVLPALRERGLTGTFYINPGTGHYRARREAWERDAPASGMELGNHTMTHKGAQDIAQARTEIAASNELIHSVTPDLPWPRLITWARPGGVPWNISAEENDALLAEHHLITRPGFSGRGAGVAFKTTADMVRHVDQAIANGAMECIIFHGVGGDWLEVATPVFTGLLDALVERRDRVWVTGHIPAHQYALQRDAATVSMHEQDAERIVLSLACAADPQFYDHSLTLVTLVPNAWRACVVEQGDRRIEVPVMDGSVRYTALPGADLITLTPRP